MRASNNHPTITGRAVGTGFELEPLAVTFKVGGRITGFGETTLWKLGRERRIRLIRLPGTRRTLIDFGSLKELLFSDQSVTEQRRRRGRPRKALGRPLEVNPSK